MTQNTYASNVGGILGYANNSNLKNLSTDVEIKSISDDNNDRAGAIVGRAERSSISIVYAKGTILNDSDKGQIGGIVGSLWENGSISNALSEVNVINGKVIHGDSGYYWVIGDNIKYLSGVQGSTAGNDRAKTVESTEIATFKEAQKIPNFQYTKPSGIVEVDYLQLENAKAENKLLYENIQKLMPLYSKAYVVKVGNEYTQGGNLSTKKLLSVVPMNNSTFVTDTIKDKGSINKLMLRYSDDTIEYVNVSFKEDYNGVVSEYGLTGSNLIYTPENYVSDFTPIVSAVKDEFKAIEFLSDGMFSILGLNPTDGDTVDKRNDKLELLYLKDSFNDVKSNIEENLTSLLVNSQILGSTSGSNNDYLLKYIRDNKKEILLGMAYVQKWYNINFDEINIKKLTSFRQDFAGNLVNELEWIVNVGKLGYNTLKGENNFNGYIPTLASNTGLSNVFEFIENYKAIFVDKTKSLSDWFKESSKAYIVEKKSLELPDEDVTVYSALKNTNRLRSTVLPLLTLSKEDVYVIKSLSSITFGTFERYMKMDLEVTNPEEYKAKVDDVKRRVDIVAEAHRAYSDFWYRIAPEVNKRLVVNNTPTWEGMYNHDRSYWYPRYGNVPKSISEFFGPSGKWHGEVKSNTEAYANGFDTWFVRMPILDVFSGMSVYAHEMTHNYDGSLYFGGRGRRDGMDAEAYARGMFESPRFPDAPEFGINLINDFSDGKLILHNKTPDRFKTQQDLQEYYKGVFDVINTMDYAEASVLIGKPTSELKEIIGQMRFDDQHRDYISGKLSDAEIEAMNLKSINDFVDNDVMIYRQDFAGYFGMDRNREDYFKAPMFTPYYGGKENDKRINRVADLKPVTINYRGNTITIDSFDKMKSLLLEAINKDISITDKYYAQNAKDLKSAIFAAYLKDTNEFKESIYKN